MCEIIEEHTLYTYTGLLIKVTSTTHPANGFTFECLAFATARSFAIDRARADHRAGTSFLRRSFRCGTIIDLVALHFSLGSLALFTLVTDGFTDPYRKG